MNNANGIAQDSKLKVLQFVSFINEYYFQALQTVETLINYADDRNVSIDSITIFHVLTECNNIFNRIKVSFVETELDVKSDETNTIIFRRSTISQISNWGSDE